MVRTLVRNSARRGALSESKPSAGLEGRPPTTLGRNRHSFGVAIFDLLKFWDAKREKRIDVRVRVHMAFLNDSNATPCYFVNVQNVSPEREVTVTHVWFATEPQVDFVNLMRPLPVRIPPRDQWETWLEIASVLAAPPEVYELARVQLGDDRVVKSVERQNVPPAGMVPGA